MSLVRRVPPRIGERARRLTASPGRPLSAAVYIGGWWLTSLVMSAIFVAVVTMTHNVVHRAVRWAVEVAVPILALAGGVLSFASFPGILVYVTMAIAGSLLNPSAYLPHHDYGDTPMSQARPPRGRVLPAVLLELANHSAHHSYRQVPSHSLPEPGHRLGPCFAASGVRPVRVP